METLRELVQLITRKRIKKVELFDEQSRGKNSNYYRLFEGIHNYKYQNDQEAAQDIYQCEPSAKKYLILKTRLKQKLLNTLFFLDTENQDHLSPREVAFYDCNRTLYHANVLILNNAIEIAAPMIEKNLKKAQEFHLTQIEYECARIMARFHHEQQNYRDFVMYRNLCERLEQRRLAEDRAERLYQEVVSTYHKSKANRHNALKLAHQHRLTVLADWQKFKSTAIETHLLKIQTFEKQLQNDYPEVLQLLNKHERLLVLHKSHCAPAQLMEMQLAKMNVHVLLRHFAEGQQYAQQLDNFTEGTLPWYQLQVLSILLALHSGQYEAAAQVFKVVLEQASFRNLDNLDKTKWLAFQAYLHYLYRSDKRREIRPLIQNTKLNFKLSEFVDDRPPFEKERRGLNISILAIQALYYLERHDTLGVGDCIQALLPYCRRYPKKDEYFRSECFINLLQLMQQENFRFYHTRKATEKIAQEMENTPMEAQTHNLFLEIMPFEQIWERMMEKLKEIKYS